MSIPPDGLVVASGEALWVGRVVASRGFSGSAGLGVWGVVGPALGLGECFELAGEVEDVALQSPRAEFLVAGVHRDDRPFAGGGVRQGPLVWCGGRVVCLDDLDPVAMLRLEFQAG